MIHIISTSTEKVGGGEIQKFEYLENEKNFLDFFKGFLSVKYIKQIVNINLKVVSATFLLVCF